MFFANIDFHPLLQRMLAPIQGKQPDAPCRTIDIDFPVMIGEWFWVGASTYLIPPNPLGMLLAQPTWRVCLEVRTIHFTPSSWVCHDLGVWREQLVQILANLKPVKPMSEKSGEWLQANPNNWCNFSPFKMWNLTRWFLSSSAFCLPKKTHQHVAIPAITSKDVHGSILIISRSQDFCSVKYTYIIVVYRIASNPLPESIYPSRNPAFPIQWDLTGLVQCATSRSTGLLDPEPSWEIHWNKAVDL